MSVCPSVRWFVGPLVGPSVRHAFAFRPTRSDLWPCIRPCSLIGLSCHLSFMVSYLMIFRYFTYAKRLNISMAFFLEFCLSLCLHFHPSALNFRRVVIYGDTYTRVAIIRRSTLAAHVSGASTFSHSIPRFIRLRRRLRSIDFRNELSTRVSEARGAARVKGELGESLGSWSL